MPGPRGSNPHELTVLGHDLLFTASDASGRELWRAIGADVGKGAFEQIKDIAPGPAGSDPLHLTRVADQVWSRLQARKW